VASGRDGRKQQQEEQEGRGRCIKRQQGVCKPSGAVSCCDFHMIHGWGSPTPIPTTPPSAPPLLYTLYSHNSRRRHHHPWTYQGRGSRDGLGCSLALARPHGLSKGLCHRLCSAVAALRHGLCEGLGDGVGVAGGLGGGQGLGQGVGSGRGVCWRGGWGGV
jgi:hypothetical protein